MTCLFQSPTFSTSQACARQRERISRQTDDPVIPTQCDIMPGTAIPPGQF